MSEYVNYLDMGDDFEDVKPWNGAGGAKVPPGVYDFEVLAVTQEPSSKGNPQVVLQLEVVSEGQYKGEKLKQWYQADQTQQASRSRLRQLCLALDVKSVPGAGIPLNDMVGRRMRAELKTEEYEKVDPRTGTKSPRTAVRMFNETAIEQPAATTAPQPTQPAVAARRPPAGANGPQRRA